MYNVDIYKNVNGDTKTLGELIAELQKIDPRTPIHMICDHSCSLLSSSEKKKGYLHTLHIDLEFDYIRKDSN